jgi:hypothetical protein
MSCETMFYSGAGVSARAARGQRRGGATSTGAMIAERHDRRYGLTPKLHRACVGTSRRSMPCAARRCAAGMRDVRVMGQCFVAAANGAALVGVDRSMVTSGRNDLL